MYKNNTILAIIPARGGSKSVPRKNIKLLAGKPLIAWTIEEAKKSRHIDRVIVSTDDEEIARVARAWGAEVPFLRPPEISADLSKDIEFLTHAVDFLRAQEQYEPDIVVLLRATSPLKTVEDIDRGIETLANNPDADASRPITEAPKHPYKMWKMAEEDKRFIEPFLPKSFTGMDEPYNGPRQELPDVYIHTGAMDVMRIRTIRELKSTSGKKLAHFFMKPEHSVNIDQPIDFKMGEFLMHERQKEYSVNHTDFTMPGSRQSHARVILISLNDPAQRLDLSYAFANNYAALGLDANPLVEMCAVARKLAQGVAVRGALAHPSEISEIVKYLSGSDVRPEALIDFPDGMGGVATKEAQARTAALAGASGGDVVINLHAVQARDRKTLEEEFAAVRRHLPEFKVIAQIPYLWQFDRDAIPWLLEALADAGAYCIKDWTTRENFLLPDGVSLDYSHESRLAYIQFMADYIKTHKLPLIIKVAGRVTAENVQSFIDAGATLIGTSYRKASSLREALLRKVVPGTSSVGFASVAHGANTRE